MNTAELLIEILTQELPAIPFLQEFPNIATKWNHSLQAHHIPPCQTQVFFTPRRIVIYAKDFPLHSKDIHIQAYGAPIAIAFEGGDPNNALTKAGMSFFTKHNLNPQTDRDKVTIATKDGKEVLYFSSTQKGIKSTELLPEIFDQFLHSLHFGKSMRWGNLSESFIRPIENICAFLGEKSLKLRAFGIDSKPQTFGHRDLGFEAIAVNNIAQYFEVLHTHKVILNQQERKEKILKQIQELEHTHNIKVELDSALLEEVVAITEYPQALLGSFEEDFLELPQEVIITSMKENQRYFAIHKQGRLFNGFVVVTNSTANDPSIIISGNQKVLRARLSDAMFFYHNDLKRGLQTKGLENIVFVQGLGSVAQKTQRELQIARLLYAKYTQTHTLLPHRQDCLALLEQSVLLAKADLLTEMVYEFPELQGIMGGYYAQKLGYDPLIAQALQEQYLPNSEDSALPSNALSALLSLANKLDSIFGLFSINKIPTGSKDPYALRRAANGILKIIQDQGFAFNLRDDILNIYNAIGYTNNTESSDTNTQPAPTTQHIIAHIESFFLERLENALPLNASIFRSALCGLDSHNHAQRDVNTLIHNALALHEVFEDTQDKPMLLSTFKRVANICKDVSLDTLDIANVDSTLFSHNAENTLFQAFLAIKDKEFATPLERTKALFELKIPLEAFFDNVLVNDKDPKLKHNRYALIGSIYGEFLRIGDIAQIAM
ncbi:glycine--tRNA ligase subunit beta [Helicobacter equorum]|uniref:Glycine--tRNA ligase beta subunit n=1 Tax=Helicobacter equorum TaxID=361872 RepID=A0A3D8IR66_9HELI|nr:glycine--tRNA ligase subunit beta [Helicobacter equorum]RDU67749.1 glycine--tRNA ligase subunit beta [Helicobacter equorum]